MSRHWIVKPNLTSLNQLHDRWRRGDDLRKRRHCENRIDRHDLWGRFDGPLAVSLAMEHFAILDDNQHPTGDDLVAD
jgi:hypothetical protein